MSKVRTVLRSIKQTLKPPSRELPSSDREFDAQLVSFTCSGRTWLRLLLGRAMLNHFGVKHPDALKLSLDLQALGDVDPRIPKVFIYHDDDPNWKKPEELETTKEKLAQKKVIFLARDPRDVMISHFFEIKKRVVQYEEAMRDWLKDYADRIKPYEGDVQKWLTEEWGSFNTIIAYYNIWADNYQVPAQFMLVRYEDMHVDAGRELRRVLEFLDIRDVSDRVISDAVEFTRFEKMRKLEKKDAFHMNALRPVDKNNTETYKTRKGQVGGHKEYLTPEQDEHFTKRMKAELSDFYGY